jgi:formylglycine-generating enzyme required for sulfatase activity
MKGRATWLLNAALAGVALLLAVALVRPGPLTASFRILLPIAPSLVNIGGGPGPLWSAAPESAPPANDASAPAAPAALSIEQIAALAQPLADWLRLDSTRKALDAQRSDFKLRSELLTRQIIEQIPGEDLARLIRRRVGLVRTYSELQRIDEEWANWRCADDPRQRPLAVIAGGPEIMWADWRRAMGTQTVDPADPRYDPLAAEQTLLRLVDDALLTRAARASGAAGEEEFRARLCRDVEVSEDEVRAAYEATDEFRRPDQVRVFEFFWPVPRNGRSSRDQPPPPRAGTVVDAIRADPRQAPDLCGRLLETERATGFVCGDLGYFRPGILPTEIDQLVFPKDKAPPPPRAELARTELGFHALLIGGAWPGVDLPLAEAREALSRRLWGKACAEEIAAFLETERSARVSWPQGFPPQAIIAAPPPTPLPPPSPPLGMVYLAGGRVTVGSTPADISERLQECSWFFGRVGQCRRAWFEDEERREVFVRPFYLDERETTMGEQLRWRRETGASPLPPEARLASPSLDHPAVGVDYFDAAAHCAARGKRLPTWEEWQFAARGVEGRRYPWGDETPDGTRANFCDVNCDRPHRDVESDDGYAKAAPVRSYPAGRSPEGVWDLAGNAREWTATADERHFQRIVGGSWASARDDLWASDVRSASPWLRADTLGFRCAADVLPAAPR